MNLIRQKLYRQQSFFVLSAVYQHIPLWITDWAKLWYS